jgi:pyocin large subunit-like protein
MTEDTKDNDQEWITVNGAHIPLKDGEPQGAVGQKITGKLSASGANPSIPDMDKAHQKTHKKHLKLGKDYPGMPMDEYVRKASALVRSPIGGDVDGYKRPSGDIVRYNKATNDYVVGHAKGVATMYKPSRGMDYFVDRMRKEGGSRDD